LIILIENHLDYVAFNRSEIKSLKKNYYYVYTDKKGEKHVKIMGLPVIKRNGTALGKKILNEVLIDRIKNGEHKFEKKFLLDLINENLKKDLSLIAQEYRCGSFKSYSIGGRTCLNAQISKNYLDEKSGKIKLIKNKSVGKVGGSSKYCTIDEAKTLKISDLDLDKIYNELQPFCKTDLSGVIQNGFFNKCGPTSSTSQTLSLKGGFFK